ncbi:MAG TPA: orotidine-5'-phosphate decarboxylase [Melioribacteraceae bacterium]|nr:orotidine-5'-phosphate decarboxylase [Melioribacteraceae bacterium]
MMNALQKLNERFKNGFHICVGLDTDITKIPKHLLKNSNPVEEFNKIIIDNTHRHAAAYKINFAFYEKDGSKGFDNIHRILEYLKNLPCLIIADAKRGDIGNTSLMYAQSVFDHFGFDAVTLHPYMGFDSIEPFLNYQDKLNFILALTSNPGSADFEKQMLADNTFLYQKVISKVLKWNNLKNCGIVFGATNLNELQDNINSFGELPVLLPGVGSQGGDLNEVVSVFNSVNNRNFLINVSRALIYSDGSENFGRKAYEYISFMNDSVAGIISK